MDTNKVEFALLRKVVEYLNEMQHIVTMLEHYKPYWMHVLSMLEELKGGKLKQSPEARPQQFQLNAIE